MDRMTKKVVDTHKPDRKRTHEIRDPIHTFVKVDNRERAIIGARPL
jgi:hypothetical protein